MAKRVLVAKRNMERFTSRHYGQRPEYKVCSFWHLDGTPTARILAHNVL